jgi:hypothetical protein
LKIWRLSYHDSERITERSIMHVAIVESGFAGKRNSNI